MSALEMFEADLRFKVDIKCPSGQMEERFLTKSFQFFDFHRTGLIEFAHFFKALEKIGVIITKVNAEKMFDEIIDGGYGQDGYLDYKKYASKVYNPDSYAQLDNQIHKPMSGSVYGDMYPAYNATRDDARSVASESVAPKSQNSYVLSRRKGMVETTTDTIEDILSELRLRIRMRGSRGFISLQRQFKVTDTYEKGSVNQFEFCKILREFGLNLLDAQYQVIFNVYDSAKSGQINYRQFMKTLMTPMNEDRQKVVVDAFK